MAAPWVSRVDAGSRHQVGVVGVVADEAGGVGAQGPDRALAGAQVVEHAPHETVGHALTPHRGIGLDVGNDERGAVEVVVGDRHDAVVDDQLVAAPPGIVANGVVDLVARLDHECSLAGSTREYVNGTGVSTP